MKNGTVVGVQYLRGLAALLVVIEHAALLAAHPKYFGTVPLGIYAVGHFGVTIFFVISGFIITLVSLRPDLTPAISRRDFFLRRFVRIFPFLWACAIAYALLRFVGTGQTDLLPTLRAMVVSPVGNLRPNVVWTLRHEILFYGLFALALLGARRRPWLLAAWFAAPIAALAVRPDWFAPRSPLDAGLLEVFASPNNLCFAAGTGIGVLYLKGKLRERLRGGFPLIALATLAAWAAVYAGGEHFAVGVLAATALVALGVSASRAEGPIERAGHLLGDASYAIYLVHALALNVLVPILAKPSLTPYMLWSHAALTVIATAVGIVAHLFVERPVTGIARRLVIGRERSAPPRELAAGVATPSP